MKGCQLKQRNHPAAALAEQIEAVERQEKEATVGDLLDILDNEQKWFALGYLSAQLNQ